MRTDAVEYTPFTGWIDPPTERAPRLEGEVSCEVAVIGGGMGGMATALRLAELGKDVVLVEAEFCGYGASSRNAGQIASVPGGDLRLLQLFSPSKVRGMVQLAENAARFAEHVMEKHAIECEYEANGLAFAAVSRGQMARVRTIAAILHRAGGRGQVGTAEELGIPRSFRGGMREAVGGMLNPGKLSRGVRTALLESSARVFEGSRVLDVRREGGQVRVVGTHGEVRADKVVLATNAYSGEWSITPPRLSLPMWIIEVESEPIPEERLAKLGWSSRSGMITQHQIMENYRLTSRNTIVFGVRKIERGSSFPLPAKTPDPRWVQELADAFSTRFPELADIPAARAWGGWIAITSSWLSVAGQLGDDVYYSIGCNGHGLAQAPYIGSMIADYIVEGRRHQDLEVVWSKRSTFPPFLLLGPRSLKLVWAFDRLCDVLNGSRRRARRAARGRRSERVADPARSRKFVGTVDPE